jgi:putative membrane protein
MDRLPAVNATLNALAFVLLLLGWRAVRARRLAAHKRFMIAAFCTSAVFLACYLTYHYVHGHTVFAHSGWPKRIYFAILLTHIPLAVVMVPPILMLLWFAAKGRMDAHRRLARWTLPVWLYVSITGVAVYFMLYQLYPSPA